MWQLLIELVHAHEHNSKTSLDLDEVSVIQTGGITGF